METDHKAAMTQERCDRNGTQDIQDLRASLSTDGLSAEHLFHFADIDSTSSRAHELARQGYPEGTLVLADCQTMGRGQHGRGWHSAQGKGAYLSLLLRPCAKPAHMTGLTLMTAVCLAEAIMETCGVAASIKWPNDLLVRGRKLSGILTEMSLTGEAIDHVIVGVGINLSHEEHDFPEEIRRQSTSIRMESGSHPGRATVVHAFLVRFTRAYRGYLEQGFASFASRWEDLSCMTGRAVRVACAGSAIEGIATGIDETGALVVRCTEGSEHMIVSGQVTLVE